MSSASDDKKKAKKSAAPAKSGVARSARGGKPAAKGARKASPAAAKKPAKKAPGAKTAAAELKPKATPAPRKPKAPAAPKTLKADRVAATRAARAERGEKARAAKKNAKGDKDVLVQSRTAQILVAPIVSEKATMAAEKHNQIIFKVLRDATKPEIKAAVEAMFKVDVVSVQTVQVKGRQKRFGKSIGRRDHVKKAYVSLAAGQEINFAGGSA